MVNVDHFLITLLLGIKLFAIPKAKALCSVMSGLAQVCVFVYRNAAQVIGDR